MKTISFLMFIMCFISFSLMGQTNKNRFDHRKQSHTQQNKPENPNKPVIRIPATENHLFDSQKTAPKQNQFKPKSTLAVKQKLDSIIYESYYDVSGQFVNSSKETYLYDANGNETQYISYTTNEITGNWQPYDKYELTYDANGNETLYIYYNWNETTSQLQPSWKYESTYDANGNNTLIISYHLNSTTNQWQPNVKYEYTYDANGNNTLSISYEWNETTSQWQPTDKEEYTYDANGNNTLYISYYWNETTSQWQPSDKEEYTYDANGNNTLYISYYWNETTSQWQPSDKEEYLYNANGNNTLYISYYWNETTSQWQSFWKAEYTYDNSFSYTNLILPTHWDDEDLFIHMLITAIRYDWDVNTSSFINDIRVAFYYSEHNTGIANSSEIGIKIYPNPANETLHIVSSTEINSISIYDIAGKLILTQEVIDKTCEVALLNIKSGIYFIEISCDSKTVIQKIIKQ
jgi:hypothetical protein